MLTPTPKVNAFTGNIKSKNTIIHVIPEFGKTTLDLLPELAISTINVRTILVRDAVFKVGPKRVNSKTHYNTLKSDMLNSDFAHIRVVKKLSNNTQSSTLVDYSKVSESIGFLSEKLSVSSTLFYMFEQIVKEMKNIDAESKGQNNHVIVFMVTKKDGGMLDVLEGLRKLSKQSTMISYGNIGKGVYINVGGGHPAIIELLGYDDSNKYRSSTPSINKARSRLPEDVAVDITTIEHQPPAPIVSGLGKNLIGIISNTRGKVVVDQPKLSKILGRVRIKNQNVVSSITKFVEAEVSEATKDGYKLTDEDLEFKVLQAISYSLTGSVDEAVTNNPEKLIARLAESQMYAIDLVLPKLGTDAVTTGRDVIPKNTRISGVNRHEFEYKEVLDKSIEELFKSLVSRKEAPVRILKIDSTTERDTKNAYKIYTITMQNTSGGFPDPYTVTLKLPALVNDKYLLLGGKPYMPATQQFLKPIVKDKKNEIRFLTHYNTDTLKIRNVIHSIGNFEALIVLMETKYPDMLTTVTRADNGDIEHVKFDNDSEFWVNSNEVIATTSKKVIRYGDSGLEVEYLDSNEVEPLNSSGVEEIFNLVYSTLIEAHPRESKLSKQEPYIEIHTAGKKLPFIIFLWQKYGLIGALVKNSIDYKVVQQNEDVPVGATAEIPLDDGSSLWAIPSTLKEELLVNGFKPFYRGNKFTIKASALSDTTALDTVFRTKYGSKVIEGLELFAELMVDVTTAKVLEKDGLPTDYLEILTGPLLDGLVNGEVQHPNNLKNVRARQAEVITSLVYKELNMAHGRLRQEIKKGNPVVKLNLNENYVVNVLLGKHTDLGEDSGAALEWIDPYSPVSELIHASRIIRTGPGGVPNSRSFRPEQRTIHKSAIGNISAHATPEYANVGLVTHNTLGVQLDRDGFYGGKVNDTDNDPFGSVSISEALVPFQNQMNSDRLIMAVTHMDQKIPINNAEPVLVGTGAEAMIPALSSSKFIHNAAMDGKITRVKKGEYVTVEYKNGKTETFDTNYRRSHISGQTDMLLSLDTLQVGDRFKANQAVAWTKNFVGNELATGRNLTMAVMSRLGKNFEDGYAITQDVADTMTTDILTTFTIRVNENMRIIDIVTSKGVEIENNGTVFEFIYETTDREFMTVNDLEDKGLTLTSKKDTRKLNIPGGQLVDFKIRINRKKGLDPLILSLFKKQSDTMMSLSKALGDKLDNVDLSILNVGGHKDRGHVFEGALLEFSISSETPIRVGDKMSGRFGTKGVVTDIIKDLQRGEYSDKIDIFISPLSIMGRKNTAVIKELYIGKILFNMPRIFSEMASEKPIKVVTAALIKVYSLLDTTFKQANLIALKEKIKSSSDASLKRALISESIRFNMLYPPFTNISFKDIRAAAFVLDIPLDEKVYIPSLDTWTKEKVPVGINYMSRMEQLSEEKEATRSIGASSPITGQPHTGKAKGGGQSVSELDIYAMLNYDSPEILQELMNTRSDNVDAKGAMIRSLSTTGESNLADLPSGFTKTNELLANFMFGMGLNNGTSNIS